MKIRPYQGADKESCLRIFQSNTPKYFDMKDFNDFESYLDTHDNGNLVVEDDQGNIVACGGYWIKDGTGRLSYGMVHSAHHGKGIGTLLFKERMKALSERCSAIEIDTSQETEGFYSRLGFKTLEVHKDMHGEGLDSVIMRLELDPAQSK